MYSKVNYTIVGLFVLLFSAGLLFFGFWLAKYGLQDSYNTYKIEMKESISGLSKDSSVKLHGVDVGRVSQIRINPKHVNMVDIYVEIKEGVRIKEDMFATTQMMGVTGLLSIEIHGGSNASKTLEPTDDYIPIITARASLLTKLTENLSGMSEKLNVLLAQSQKLLSDKNINTFGNILNNTEDMTKKALVVEDKAIVALEEANITLEEFRVSMAQITNDVKQVQKDFAEIKEVSIPTIDTLMETSQNFNRVTLKMEKSLDRGDYNLKKMFEPVIVDVQILAKELSTMSRELGDNPSALLFKSRKPRRGPGE
jgi:phospholipid/cholesterol/gamma-HCH transport system substrate-binding protein